MPRYIVIPIYDHTDEDEVEEIMDELSTLGFANSPYLASTPAMPERKS